MKKEQQNQMSKEELDYLRCVKAVEQNMEMKGPWLKN